MKAGSVKRGLAVIIMVGLGVAGYQGWRWMKEADLRRARAFYAGQERFFRPRPYAESPPGIPSLHAESCGECHKAITEEWRGSTHARAWLDDAQYQAELHKHEDHHGGNTSWVCLHCHTPLENQLEQLVVGLEDGNLGKPIFTPNPNYDAKLQREAITCATCHVKDGVILGVFGDGPAPHPVRKAPELLESSLCLACHQAQAEYGEVALACVFNTGNEWRDGPYSKEGKTCQSCHMPEVERKLTWWESSPVRKGRRHSFGGCLIPKRPEDEAAVAKMREHFPEGAALRWVELPETLPKGREVALSFELENAEAGHMLPTGDPERFLRIKAQALSPTGRVLGELTERIGTTYEWEPLKKLSDNRLAPGEVRRLTLRFEAPARGPVTLRLMGEKWRIGEEAFEFHKLEGKVVPMRLFFDEARELPVSP